MPLHFKDLQTQGLTAEPEEAVSIWNSPKCTHLCTKKAAVCVQAQLVCYITI